MKLELNKL